MGLGLGIAAFALGSLAGCFKIKEPSVFDWGYDRVRVVAVRVWPIVADARVPRTVDALVLRPRGVGEVPVRVEVCGDRGDMAVYLAFGEDIQCFSEPSLVDVVARALPASWTPTPRDYTDCPTFDVGLLGASPFHESWDSAEPPPSDCGSAPLLRVVAGEGADEASALALPTVRDDGYDPTADHDTALADPRIEVVDGTLAAGQRVLLRFSVAASWTASPSYYIDEYPEHRWYVEAGTPWGTGITRTAGFDAAGRPYAQNWLEIPPDHHGPLRVAVVRDDAIPVWTEITLEVP